MPLTLDDPEVSVGMPGIREHHTPFAIDLRLRGDPARLRQILLNLAGNAVKFTAHGGAGLSVSVSAQGYIVFKVADTGEGISDDRQRRIFEEFEHGGGEIRDAD